MSMITISDLDLAELKHSSTSLTDDERASIRGGLDIG